MSEAWQGETDISDFRRFCNRVVGFGDPPMPCAPYIDFTRVPKLPEAIAWAEKQNAGAGFTSLLRATASREIALAAIISPRERWTPRHLTSSLPTVLLIADDAGESRNPDEWRSSISAIAWAQAAVIHGTGAQQWHYEEAIYAAKLFGRCLFIETDSAHAAAWLAAIAPRRIPALTFIPPPGTGPHPLEMASAAE